MYTHDGPRVYLTADKSAVVTEGDPRAAFLLIAPGQTMSDDDAVIYGLPLGKGGEEPAEEPEQVKQANAKPNKARTPRENKGA